MPKLKFKGDDERDGKRERKHRKREKRRHDQGDDHGHRSKRRHTEADMDTGRARKWASSDDEEMPGPMPSGSGPSRGQDGYRSTTDDDTLRAEVEERMFREKMFDALGEDERLDGIEAQFNDFSDYIHIPHRGKVDPTSLDDDEYAEWVRLGMYRKTHAAEHAERLRRKAAAEERRAAEKARRRETRRLERLEAEEREARRQERRAKRVENARVEYQSRWKRLLEEKNNQDVLRFHDIPWPIAAAYDKNKDGSNAVLAADAFTKEAISAFLLPSEGEDKRERKERLRESFLRFHPDKFEGRFMRRIRSEDEAVSRCSRIQKT
ncbi:hypothetical protein CC1G_14238 [Coprinopsis cinerea okayama7|uniref:Uncharacterized protein n=1 Tax=Coprinopsis cinerea (strain Okayama-7 / 130 / ATCC MYA-4618 / FGSC 9003) TaxID=240176 RepID=D6RLP5_COPC7|nr:hypothetical protein CC1G_14238 [Coprinopsis cinerea okayama7\|eukprot:XP_002911707.1 hypothetical protein CC1G_14238 [Coprinopsis cinerea okayama7\